MHLRSALPEGVKTLFSYIFKIYQRTILERFVINRVSTEILTTELMISSGTDSP